MSVHDGHRDRIRARFHQSGLEGFAEHEALELLLFYGRPRCDTNEIAHRLITRFGSFAAVLDAPYEELVKVNGVGEACATLLKLVPQLGAYYLNNAFLPGDMLDSTQKAGTFFLPKFIGKKTEELWLAALDDKRKVLYAGCISEQGIVNAVRISIKKVVAKALSTNATGVVIAHNHPGGIALPSLSDKQMTTQVYQALRYINVQLLDHIIVAENDYVSMADSGYIKLIEQNMV